MSTINKYKIKLNETMKASVSTIAVLSVFYKVQDRVTARDMAVHASADCLTDGFTESAT